MAMGDILEMFFLKETTFVTEGKTVNTLATEFRHKLCLIAESVEKLPNTFIQSVEENIVNELHNTMYWTQMSEFTDHCIKIVDTIQGQLASKVQNEVQLLLEKLNVLRSTWDSCRFQFQKNFTGDEAAKVAEITEEMTSAIYLSNNCLTAIDVLFSKLLEANIDRNHEDTEGFGTVMGSPGDEIDEKAEKKTTEALQAVDLNFIDNFYAIFDSNDLLNYDSYDNMSEILNESHAGKNDLTITTSELTNEREANTLSQGVARDGHDEINEIIDFLLNCQEDVPSTPDIAGTTADDLLAIDTSSQLCPLQIKSPAKKDEIESENITVVSHCQEQFANDHNDLYEEHSSPSCKKARTESTIEREVSCMSYDEQLQYCLKQMHPKTKEGVCDAVARVAQYLHEEEVWAKKMSRRAKMASSLKPSRKSKLARPVIPADVQVYIKLGILPWDVKNSSCPPANDSHCELSIPSDVKSAVLKRRSWYPTLEDKLYCFENHSIYLFDIELFGCWECIRKYYNDIYKWASNIGLVLRRIRL